jgi:uncharacterized membrane protein YkvA (DUF1232 family)
MHVLAHELAGYTNSLAEQARDTEFFDVQTAKLTATLCHKLLAAVPTELDKDQHLLVQLAISYFVLEEDAEDDNHSLIGFDDDLQVVVAAIEELGFHHLLEEGSDDG